MEHNLLLTFAQFQPHNIKFGTADDSYNFVNSGFNASNPTKIIIHGYLSSIKEDVFVLNKNGKCNSSMNQDNGPILTSPLFALINKDSYGSVNRGNKFSINSANANLVGETFVEKSVVVRCFVENVQFFVSTPKVPVPTPGLGGLTKSLDCRRFEVNNPHFVTSDYWSMRMY
ncbi:hypothetical protein NQ318_017022 [Aromia moschata]|uniref:Uncharacterized protein n=1 Tax=Aromia moschata TaxID=1265417 RepID=A0AAV8XY78_9CUCU|nr:hypothetical protein NQ318_017022 [Aromia moschata]